MRASRAVEYRLDEEAMTYEEAWAWDGDRALYSAFMGDAERLADGSTLVSWGNGGRLEQGSPDGDVPWRAESEIGAAIGYTHHVDLAGLAR